MGVWSWMLGALDGTYSNYQKVFSKKGHVWFSNGIGDRAKFRECVRYSNSTTGKDFMGLEVSRGEEEVKDGLVSFEITGLSPIAHLLYCEEAKTLRALVLEKEGLKESERKGVVLHFYSTGDQGYNLRRKIAADELARRGYTNIIHMMPGGAKRKPSTQTRHFIDTVTDYLVTCLATFTEGASLLNWARVQYPGSPCALTGMSFGGTTALSVGMYDSWNKEPLAVVPFLAPSSAVGFVTADFFKSQFDMKKISEIERKSEEETKKEIISMMSELDLMHWCKERQMFASSKQDKAVALIFSYARHDAVVTKEECEVFMEALHGDTKHFEQYELEGGHLSSILMGDSDRVDVVGKVERALELALS